MTPDTMNTTRHDTTCYDKTPHHTIQYNATQNNATRQILVHNTVRHTRNDTTLHDKTVHKTTQCNTATRHEIESLSNEDVNANATKQWIKLQNTINSRGNAATWPPFRRCL